MKTINDPFTVLLPHLDLHGETLNTMKYQIEVFLKDNYKLGKKEVVIIHGRSGAVLKKETQNILKNIKIVEDYYIDSVNDGQTIVKLKNKDE